MQDPSIEPTSLVAPLYPPLETFIDRRNPRPISLNLGFNRFRWPAFAPLYEIKVLRDPTDADSEQDPYQTQAGEGTSSLHPIASELYTNPPLSSLKASIDILDHYGSRDAWEDLHTVDRPEDDTEVPCECCDRMPYRPPEPLVIRATSNAGVTIGNIVSQVNKYVNDLRGDVLEALDTVGEYAGQRSRITHSGLTSASTTSISKKHGLRKN
ncbi:hypothetical protein CCHR01_04778 [Colletotrichum chrysophilum]|uniref:Uncharacterized protein n=1 Tax=Colletotrichum chrysophilum TaxID=1836956 RepID=A0AAD9ASC3_9PEZI|nr:hypothetical protein CCHR01_04778 [Colletotrichum chrysophilum]